MNITGYSSRIKSTNLRNLTFLILILISLVNFACSSGGSSTVDEIDDPEKAFFIAKSLYDKGDYLDAIDEFTTIKLKFSGSSIIDKSLYYLGMSYYKREEYILANYEFESILRNYPSSEFYENARYMLGMCYYGLSPVYTLDQTYTRYAINEFQNYIELYPNGKYAVKAERKISELKTKLAFKEYKSAELYYDIGKYKSALVYYMHITEEYQDTKYADDALYGVIKTQFVKKQYDQASESIKKFEDRYPTSPFLRNVLSIKSQIPY
ncbi:MAG TPA: outer membrane protein assembly factor BamD [Ignavibacteria bacterium]|nr:outer membrane protein assembly factor BamD [Ignavibacteria bacterium]HMR40682.1 outer membrane protein assembly factor BamD [Ignavibacteria bacterium]